MAHGMFPRGAIELVEHFMHSCDVVMSSALSKQQFEGVPVNERILFGVQARLTPMASLIRSWPQAMALGVLPHNLPYTLQLLGRTVDEIWYHAGDRSTDVNWYTRRGLLLGIYSSTGVNRP